MKHLPQFPPVLAIYCFCVLQIPASGFPQSFADLPDDLDIVQLERLAYWATLPTQPKDNQDIHKRFPPMHPLMHLAAKLANRTMKRFLLQDDAATLGRPFFLFRPRNGRNTDSDTQ
ncbi:neuromedin-S isoform X2 [Manis javanica]|uniref:neuromedin-S isoform X2 n=1 Tax=Manis javanica TaxID=9974 RepID=UPI003C6D71C4